MTKVLKQNLVTVSTFADVQILTKTGYLSYPDFKIRKTKRTTMIEYFDNDVKINNSELPQYQCFVSNNSINETI